MRALSSDGVVCPEYASRGSESRESGGRPECSGGVRSASRSVQKRPGASRSVQKVQKRVCHREHGRVCIQRASHRARLGWREGGQIWVRTGLLEPSGRRSGAFRSLLVRGSVRGSRGAAVGGVDRVCRQDVCADWQSFQGSGGRPKKGDLSVGRLRKAPDGAPDGLRTPHACASKCRSSGKRARGRLHRVSAESSRSGERVHGVCAGLRARLSLEKRT